MRSFDRSYKAGFVFKHVWAGAANRTRPLTQVVQTCEVKLFEILRSFEFDFDSADR